MQHFAYFIGRFHVLALHLPITLVLVVVALEWYRSRQGRVEFEPALRILWAATAISAVLTAVLGYLHFSEGGFTGPAAYAHRALGTSLALATCLAWGLRVRSESVFRLFSPVIGLVLVALVFLTGHFGGDLTHGSAFLVEYGPNFLRRAAGLEDERPPVRVIGEADPYLDVVRPILTSHCASCHNRDKRRGGLDVTQYAAFMRGGDDGPVLIAGDATQSDLIRRVSLSPEQEDFMPKEGKPPLSPEQIAVLTWWIDAGAKTGIQVAKLSVPAGLQPVLEAQVHSLAAASNGAAVLTPAGAAQPAGSAMAQTADPRVIQELSSLGLVARQISQSDPHLVVSPIAPGSAIKAAQIQRLVAAGADQIVDLDLRGANLDGAAIASLGNLHNLRRLRLDENRLVDSDLHALSALSHLEVLGLYGNEALSDGCLSILSQMPALRRVYLWRTRVSNAAVERLQAQRRDLVLDTGDIELASRS
jgi:uncharacterized membrane protein